jgi:hypothetical protein
MEIKQKTTTRSLPQKHPGFKENNVSKHSIFHFSGNVRWLMAWGGYLILFISDIMAGINRFSGKFPGLKIVFVNTILSPKVDTWETV